MRPRPALRPSQHPFPLRQRGLDELGIHHIGGRGPSRPGRAGIFSRRGGLLRT
jgi:hypothetical protein